MGFELKTNTNLQLGLGLKNVTKLGQNRSTKTEPNWPQKAWFGLVFSLQIWLIWFLSHIKLIIPIWFIFLSKDQLN